MENGRNGGPFGGNNQASVIYAQYGNHNTFSQSQINGTWNGTTTTDQQGTDDGIVLGNEDGDLVANNTISNVWDAGIESVGPLTNTIITNNTITTAGVTGIGSYWSTFWSGNTVRANRVSHSPSLALFQYDGIAPPSDNAVPPIAAITFQNNTFSGNVFESSNSTTSNPMTMDFSQNGFSGGHYRCHSTQAQSDHRQ